MSEKPLATGKIELEQMFQRQIFLRLKKQIYDFFIIYEYFKFWSSVAYIRNDGIMMKMDSNQKKKNRLCFCFVREHLWKWI